MTRYAKDVLATIEYALSYERHGIHCKDRYLARRVNPWRDIFPPGLAALLQGREEGEAVKTQYPPGEAVPGQRASLVRTVPWRAFCVPAALRGRVKPRLGRFYPQGFFRGLPGVFPSTVIPARVVGAQEDGLLVDTNHPAAGLDLQLQARLLRMEKKRSDTGGRLFHWMEELCNWGPGMQVCLPHVHTDFEGPDFYRRDDPRDDRIFYAHPRIIGHVDDRASHNLQREYGRFLRPGMRVLDLMSSVHSHLPDDMDLEVTALGLNETELAGNPLAAHRLTHDLNAAPDLPDGLGTFDAVLISLSFEYLTDPVRVLGSVRQALAPGGVVLLGTSNRWFPGKAIHGWMELHEFERMGFMLQCLQRAGFDGSMGTVSVRNDWRPVEDRHFVATRGVSDPVYVVWARRGG